MSHVALLTYSASSSEYTLAVIEPNLFLSSTKAGTSYPMQRITYKGTDSPTHLTLRPEHNSAYVAAGNKVYPMTYSVKPPPRPRPTSHSVLRRRYSVWCSREGHASTSLPMTARQERSIAMMSQVVRLSNSGEIPRWAG